MTNQSRTTARNKISGNTNSLTPARTRRSLANIENKAPSAKDNVADTAAASAELVNKQILERLEKLEAENEQLRARQDAGDEGNSSSDGEDDDAGDNDYKQKYFELQQRYTEKCSELEAEKTSSRSKASNDVSVPDGSVPRPRGAAGTHYSIQVAMGLAGTENKHLAYQGILRGVKDIAARAGLNWELAWRDIEVDKKIKVFRMAREKLPYLKRFRNDWATEDIIKQYFKNRRSHSYRKGFIEVPEKYTYLKENAHKRSTDGSRVKKAKAVLAAKKKGKESSATTKKRTRERHEDVDEGSGAASRVDASDGGHEMDVDSDDD